MPVLGWQLQFTNLKSASYSSMTNDCWLNFHLKLRSQQPKKLSVRGGKKKKIIFTENEKRRDITIVRKTRWRYFEGESKE